MRGPSQYQTRYFLDFTAIIITLVVVSVTTWHAFTVERSSADTQSESTFKTTAEANDPYTRFSMELFDTIQAQYWREVSDADLGTLYREAARHVLNQVDSGNVPQLATTTRTAIANMMQGVYATAPEDKLHDIAVTHAQVVLNNLQPTGRSRLLTTVEETKLRDEVANVDSEKKLYDIAGAGRASSTGEITRAIAKKEEQLAQVNTETAKEQLAQLKEAKEVLTDERNKERYDSQSILPTVAGRQMNESVYYIKLEKISPTTIQDFVKVANEAPTDTKIDSLILDLRGNVGGSVGLLQYLLGPFIGPNQNAYTFFHQGKKNDHKTKAGWLDSLVKYKKVAILIDKQTQSSAETMAAALKTYNVGVLVGEKTRGWGTIENTYELKTDIHSNKSYTAFLVNNLTLRTDGQPIEDNGVVPHIRITDENWRDQLNAYYNFPPLISAIEKLYVDDSNMAR